VGPRRRLAAWTSCPAGADLIASSRFVVDLRRLPFPQRSIVPTSSTARSRCSGGRSRLGRGRASCIGHGGLPQVRREKSWRRRELAQPGSKQGSACPNSRRRNRGPNSVCRATSSLKRRLEDGRLGVEAHRSPPSPGASRGSWRRHTARHAQLVRTMSTGVPLGRNGISSPGTIRAIMPLFACFPHLCRRPRSSASRRRKLHQRMTPGGSSSGCRILSIWSSDFPRSGRARRWPASSTARSFSFTDLWPRAASSGPRRRS